MEFATITFVVGITLGVIFTWALRPKQLNNADILLRIERTLMGVREDFDLLTRKFDAMESAVTAVAEDIAALKEEIKEANDRANIDLSPLVARAEGIEAGLRAAVGAGPGSDPEAPTETPAEG